MQWNDIQEIFFFRHADIFSAEKSHVGNKYDFLFDVHFFHTQRHVFYIQLYRDYHKIASNSVKSSYPIWFLSLTFRSKKRVHDNKSPV